MRRITSIFLVIEFFTQALPRVCYRPAPPALIDRMHRRQLSSGQPRRLRIRGVVRQKGPRISSRTIDEQNSPRFDKPKPERRYSGLVKVAEKPDRILVDLHPCARCRRRRDEQDRKPGGATDAPAPCPQ